MGFRLSIKDGREARQLVVDRRVTAGSSRRCGIKVDDPGGAAVHLVIRQTGELLEVVDSGKGDGFRYEGVLVQQAVMRPGDSIQVGNAKITFAAVTSVPTPPAKALKPPATRRAAPAPKARPAPLVPPEKVPTRKHPSGVTRRNPRRWMATSLILHAVLVAAFWSTTVLLGRATGQDGFDMALTVVDNTPVEELRDREEETPEFEDPLTEVPPEEFVPTPLDPVKVEKPPPEKVEEEPPPVRPPTHEPRRETIGIVSQEASSVLMGADFGSADAGRANASAAGALLDSGYGAKLIAGLRGRANRDTVRVVKGQWDESEQILAGLDLEYRVMRAGDLAKAPIPDTVRAMLFNCTSYPLAPRARQHLRDWVAAGGHAMTTDWCLQYVIEPTFPGYLERVRIDGVEQRTLDEAIGFVPRGRHPLLRGFPQGRVTKWWLDDSSRPFVVKDHEHARTVLASADMRKRYGSGALVVEIDYGEGRIVHSISHAYLKKGNVRGAMAMQRMVVNFLHQATKRR